MKLSKIFFEDTQSEKSAKTSNLSRVNTFKQMFESLDDGVSKPKSKQSFKIGIPTVAAKIICLAM